MGKHLYNECTKGSAGELLVASLFGLLQSPSRDRAASDSIESSSAANRGLGPRQTGGS